MVHDQVVEPDDPGKVLLGILLTQLVFQHEQLDVVVKHGPGARGVEAAPAAAVGVVVQTAVVVAVVVVGVVAVVGGAAAVVVLAQVRLDEHVGVGAVLEQGQGEVVDVVEIGADSGVGHHVHEGVEDVGEARAEPDVGVQSVCEQKGQEFPDEVKPLDENYKVQIRNTLALVSASGNSCTQ